MNNAVIELKKTPLHGWHVANGAKMGPFGEWEMPLRYSGEMKEWRAVREKAGLFDISHMGVISVVGLCSETFVQYVTTNDVSRLDVNGVQYTLLCNENGGILDDVTVYKSLQGVFFFVVNASNAAKIYAWFLAVNHAQNFHVDIANPKHQSLFALQGPSAENILTKVITNVPHKRYSFRKYFYLRQPSMFVSRTGYTGEDGFEIICRNVDAEILWEEILKSGKDFGLLPCGLVARDMLRTEAGMRLYGNDIDETINPIEAGLEKYVSFDKGDFIGKSALEKMLALKKRGGGRFFTGFIMDAKPEHGAPIFTDCLAEEEIGIITSATYSPHLRKRIALGYLSKKHAPGETVWVNVGEKICSATVAALPFYSRKK